MTSSAPKVLALFLFGGACLGAAGCERDKVRTDAPPPLVKGAPTLKATVDNEAAVRNIAAVRCQHEVGCNNVGEGKKYPSLSECTDEIERTFRKDIDGTICHGGVVKEELEACLGAITHNDCNNPKDAIEQLIACRTSGLCKLL